MALKEVDRIHIWHGKRGVRKVSMLAAATIDDKDDLQSFKEEFSQLLMNYEILGPEAADENIDEGIGLFNRRTG